MKPQSYWGTAMRFLHIVFATLILFATSVCAPLVLGQGDGSEEDQLAEVWESQKSVSFDFGDSSIRLVNQHQLFSFATGAESAWSVSDENQEPLEITDPVTTGSASVNVVPFEATASAVATWGMVMSEFDGSAELVNTVGGTATIADKFNPALVAVSWGSHTSSVELGEEVSQGVIDWTPAISVGTGGGAFVSAYDQISIHDPLIVRTRNEQGELSAPVKVFEFNATFDSETRFRWNQLRRIFDNGVDGPQVIVEPDEGPFLDAGSRGTGSFSLSFLSDLIPQSERGTISVSFAGGVVTNSTATGAFADIAPVGGPLEAGESRLPTVGGVAVIDELLPVPEGNPVANSNQRFRLALEAGSRQVINDAAACSDGVQVTVGPAVDMVQTFTINPLQRTELAPGDEVGTGIGDAPDPNGTDPIGTSCLGVIAADAELLFGTDYVSRGNVSLFAGQNASPIDRVLRFRSTSEQPRQVAFFDTGVYDAEPDSTAKVHRWTTRFDVRTLSRKKTDNPVVLPPIDPVPVEPETPVRPLVPVEPTDPKQLDSDSGIRVNPGVIGSVNTATDVRTQTIAPVAGDLRSPRFVVAMFDRNSEQSAQLTNLAPTGEDELRLFEQKVEGLLFSVLEDNDIPIAKLTWNGRVLGERELAPDLIEPTNNWRYFDLSLMRVAKGLNVAVHAVDEKRQVVDTIIERTIPDLELSPNGYRLAVGATSGDATDDESIAAVIHDFDNLMTTFQNLGDVAWDGQLNGADFRRVERALERTTGDPLFDLNFDGQINVADLETIEDMIPNKIAGDANFDGHVRFDDFLKLSRSYGEETGLWSRGDFDSNGEVGFLDFLALSKNFEAAIATDADPVDAVPEPSTAYMLVAVLGGMLCLRGEKQNGNPARKARGRRRSL